MVKLNNATQRVDNALCEDAGLSVPETIERCGQSECPRWLASGWTPCKESRCISRHKAVQRRDVTCRRPIATAAGAREEEDADQQELSSAEVDDGNGMAVVPDEQCAEDERPVPRQECYNSRCVAAWHVEPWSEVG